MGPEVQAGLSQKFLTPAIYELEKLLWQYKTMELPEKWGVLH